MAAKVLSPVPGPVPARYPHLVFRSVLGPKRVAALLAYVAAREKEFRPGVVRNRSSGKHRIDRSLRDCAYLGDIGPVENPLKTFLGSVARTVIADLHLLERSVAPREFEICAYRDGGHFGPHIDTWETQDPVRVVSCVYYFAASPPTVQRRRVAALWAAHLDRPGVRVAEHRPDARNRYDGRVPELAAA
jgi:hypothetical protein